LTRGHQTQTPNTSLPREHSDHFLPAPSTASSPAGLQTELAIVPLQLGDAVLLQELHPQSLQPHWTGPHTVILTIPTVAKFLGYSPWYHVSHLKRVPFWDTQSWTSTALGPTKLKITRQPPITEQEKEIQC
uniref:Murine leukemia virus integrase C-terminal domain-containing protein n=1 Tax=Sciurus vulgaris TaxID=55149 RepID=A0A8D2DGP3_SCIVU